MLIEFSTANFRSIKECQKLTLVAGSGKELLEQNTFDAGLTGFPRLLRSAVIYGANAAGLMMTLYSLMGVRRKAQIKTALAVWKAAPGQGYKIRNGERIPSNSSSNPCHQ